MRIARYLAVALAVACAVLAPKAAYAQLLCPSLTLQEGTSAATECSLNNNSALNSGAITIGSPSTTPFGMSIPDSTDTATNTGFSLPPASQDPCTPGATLALDQHCFFFANFTTDNAAGETDNDSGHAGGGWEISMSGVPDSLTGNFFDVTVTDPPPPAATPEPSSLALIPLGLGALLLMRKRMIDA